MLRVYFENGRGRIYAHLDGYAFLRYHAYSRSLLDVQEFFVHTGQSPQASTIWRVSSAAQRPISGGNNLQTVAPY